MTIIQEEILNSTTDDSLQEIKDTQKQLDQELKHLKNRYSRYSQLVSYQQDEEEESNIKINSFSSFEFSNKEEKINNTEDKLIENDEKIEKIEKSSENINTNDDDEEQEKEMSRLCNLVQSLLTEAQDAIESKPDIHEDEDEKVDSKYDLPSIPRRLDSLNGYHPESTENESENSKEYSSNRYSIMTDSTAVAQSSMSFDMDNDYNYSKLNSPGLNQSFYFPNEGRNYMSNEYYNKNYGSNPGYNELNQSRIRLNHCYEFNQSRMMYDEMYKGKFTNREDYEYRQQKQSSVELVPHRRKHRRHRRRRRSNSKHIHPLDANGEPVCPVHSAVVEKKQSKLFKAQFGSDTQLFISFFTSFFVTSILVTISCLWSVIQVMAGNVNDRNLSRLLKSSSENAISKNKKRIEEILEKEESSSNSSSSSSSDEEEEEGESDEEKIIIKENHYILNSKPSTDSISSQYYTAQTSPMPLEYEINNQRSEFYEVPSYQDYPDNFSNDYNNSNIKNSSSQSTTNNNNSYYSNLRRNSL